jgi:hypothetical protein
MSPSVICMVCYCLLNATTTTTATNTTTTTGRDDDKIYHEQSTIYRALSWSWKSITFMEWHGSLPLSHKDATRFSLGQLNPVHTFTTYVSETEINQWIVYGNVVFIILFLQYFSHSENDCFQVLTWNLMKQITLFLVAAIWIVSLLKQIHGTYDLWQYVRWNLFCNCYRVSMKLLLTLQLLVFV